MPDLANNFENLVDLYDKQSEKDNLQRLMGDAQSEENARQRNIMNSERWYKKRFGIRPQFVTFPWRNASNLHMPLTDTIIRRNKPSFASLIGGSYPTVMLESNVLGDDQLLVRGVERQFQQMLFDEDKMNIFLDAAWGIDLMLERGRFVTKVIQEFTPMEQTVEIVIENLSMEMRQFLFSPQTKDEMIALELSIRYQLDLDDAGDVAQIKDAIKQFRAGKPRVTFERKVNMTPFPTLCVRDPNTILFPQNTTYNIGNAQWIRDRVLLDFNAMEERVDSGTWNKKNGRLLLERIARDERTGNSRYTQNVKDYAVAGPERLELQREGVAEQTTANAWQFDEFYFWKLMPGKRLAERMVLTVHPQHPDLPLRMIRYPYVLPDGRPEEWPFDQVMFEVVSDRAMAPRGYPQLLDSLQTEITNNHNAKQNWMTLANSLTIKAKRNSGVTTNWVPGQPLWVNRMDDADVINMTQRDMSYDNEERGLTNWAEQYIGLVTQTLTDQSNTPERRTKAEVETLNAMQAQVASLDIRVFQACMQKVYRKIWNRWMQYGPENIVYPGPNGNPVSVAKQDLKNRLQVRTAGDLGTTNRQLRAAQMDVIFQTLRGDQRANQDALYKLWLGSKDERVAGEVLLSAGQVQQEQIERIIADIERINVGYTVVPRPSDDNEVALQVITNYLNDPVKRRNFHVDRLPALQNFFKAHELAAEKKQQETTRGGRAQQEVARTAAGQTGREARQ